VSISTDVPTWVVASRSEAVDGALVPEYVSYESQSIVGATGQVDLAPQTFAPTPEARWSITN
jgi:hypothetical protein